jgi:uncharacterized membrane protein
MIFAMWFGFQKVPQKYPQIFFIFQKVGDGFCYEIYIYIHNFHQINIEVLEKEI